MHGVYSNYKVTFEPTIPGMLFANASQCSYNFLYLIKYCNELMFGPVSSISKNVYFYILHVHIQLLQHVLFIEGLLQEKSHLRRIKKNANREFALYRPLGSLLNFLETPSEYGQFIFHTRKASRTNIV